MLDYCPGDPSLQQIRQVVVWDRQAVLLNMALLKLYVAEKVSFSTDL